MSMFLAGLTWLLVFQSIGESLSRLARLPVPGPVVGLALLFATLLARPAWIGAVEHAADGLAKHLSLLFVPAGVGVTLYASRIASEWLPIVVALVASTVLAIATAALTFAALAKRAGERSAEP